MFPEDKEKSKKLIDLLKSKKITNENLSIAVIDLKEPVPKIFGFRSNEFIYPASVYKIFIGAEVLRQIEIGNFSLSQEIVVTSPNDVDKDPRIFPGDTRKLLNEGDKATIDYLLNLMLTRSDNTASNVLIDLVGRENITENICHKNGWHGSEITRKFLNRSKEDKKCRFSESTKTCARHIAEFFYLVENEKLISPFVSRKLKEYMSRWNRAGRTGLLIDDYASFYRKGGWLETNLYKENIFSLLKAVITKRWAVIRWEHDAGVVTGKNSKYAVTVMTISKSIDPKYKPRIKKIAKVIHDFMEKN